jgi:outer membrane protein TolC
MQVSSPLFTRWHTWVSASLLHSLIGFGFQLQAQSKIPKPATLTPEFIVSRIVSDSIAARELRLSVAAAEVGREAARASLDTILSAQTSQQWNKAESIGAPSASSDWTLQASGQLVQNLASGTQLSYQYQMIHNEANVPAAIRFFRSDRSHLQAWSVGVTHELWRNRDGSIVNQQLAVADKSVSVAQLAVDDQLESFSQQALELYWQAVALSNSIDELQASRERFDELLRYSRDRGAFGLNEVGDADRIKADREATSQRIVSTRALLDQLIARVATLLKVAPPPAETLQLNLPTDIGPRPSAVSMEQEHQKIKVVREQLAVAELEVQVAELQTDPRLAAFARAATTGVDPAVGDSIAEMGTLKKPTLTIGLQFEMPLDNFGAKAQLASKRIRSEQLKLQLERVADDIRSLDLTLVRDAQAAWDLVRSAEEIVSLRAKVARDLRDAYRQGRLGLDQVILATNQQLLAKIDRTEKVTNYLRAYDRLLAHRGSLIRTYTGQTTQPSSPR